jgi:L-asparaginase/Glu-tRNA(Gln) amidotransferase subunit D
MASLARLTNVVQQALASGQYAGAIWLEGSPYVEETSYWLNLLLDTTVPIVGNASQRAHGAVGNDGDRNIIDAADYIVSRIWADERGRDTVGVVVMQDEQTFTARVPLAIAGNNLTATKARLLLMACLLRFGSLPPAADPLNPTAAELEAIRAKLAEYQAVFDTH